MKKLVAILMAMALMLTVSAGAMRIQHNVSALNAHRNLTNDNSILTKNLEKLSSGYRVNRAGNDAAELAISDKMRQQLSNNQEGWLKLDGSSWYYTLEDEDMLKQKNWQLIAAEQEEASFSGNHYDFEEQARLASGQGWNMCSGLYGKNNMPAGMFTGLCTENTVNGIGYELNAEGKLDASFQLTLMQDRRICVNDNPEIALMNTQGDVTFFDAGTVNIGVFDAYGNVVDSFSVQVNADGSLETAPYANKIVLNLGDTGSFEASDAEDKAPAGTNSLSDGKRIDDVDLAEEVLKYTKNNILQQAAQGMLKQANPVPQDMLQ